MVITNISKCAMAAFVAVALLSFEAPSQTTTNTGSGENSGLDETAVLKTSQAAIGREVGDYVFRDTEGARVRLSDLRGKPVVISMIYSACADVCPMITQTLARVDAIARDALGDDTYSIITVGFDAPADNPARMKSFARQQGIDVGPHWRFLSGDLPTILALSEDLGFRYYESPKGFDHLTQTTILDADGRVYRQIYGETFEAPHFVEPLKALIFGTDAPFSSLTDLIGKVRLFCTIYDPAADRYRFEYAIFFRLFVGGVIIISMMTFIGKWLWQNRRRNTRKHNSRTLPSRSS